MSNIAAIIALALLYQMAEDIRPGLGYRAVIYLTLFPVAFFLVAAYTESLYLLFAIACLRLAHRNRPGWAGLFAAMATLTRFQEVILALPILYEGIRPAVQTGRLRWDQIKIKTVIAVTAPLLAEAVFVMYIHFYLSFPWPWQTLNSEWAQHVGWPWEGLLGNFTSPGGDTSDRNPHFFSGSVLRSLLVSPFGHMAPGCP